MGKLVSCTAIVSAEVEISMGAPTVYDIVNLINKGNYTLEVYEPIGSSLSIVIREVEK